MDKEELTLCAKNVGEAITNLHPEIAFFVVVADRAIKDGTVEMVYISNAQHREALTVMLDSIVQDLKKDIECPPVTPS